jgi:hypothetical protein
MTGDVSYALGHRIVAHQWGDDEFSQYKEIPAAGVFLDAGGDVLGGFKDPARAMSGAVTLGGLIDPRIPMYGQLPTNMVTGLMK